MRVRKLSTTDSSHGHRWIAFDQYHLEAAHPICPARPKPFAVEASSMFSISNDGKHLLDMEE